MEQFYFVLTEKCNLECSHCIRDSSPYRNETTEKILVEKTVLEITRLYKESTILLSGGEPTLHRYFNDILDFCLQLGNEVIVNSNGTTSFFSYKNLKHFADYPNLSIQISLDGSSEIHDEIRGAGNFQRSLDTIKSLRDLGINCSVSCTVLDVGFFNYSTSFLKSVDELGLAHIAIKRATYAGRASSGVTLSTSEWNEQVYALREQNWKTKILASPMYDFKKLDSISDDAITELKLPASSINCGAGTAKAYIYPNGDVCSCTCFKDLPLGNLYEDELGSILSNGLLFSISSKTCNTCRYFKLCNGGCLGSGYQYSGKLGEPDPRCPKVNSRQNGRIQVVQL